MPLSPLHPPSPIRIIEALIELNLAEDAASKLQRMSPKARDRIAAARAIIPTPILGHHDRMRARRRRSVAAARHGVCTACHIALSGGAWNQLKKQSDLALCENCGTYIYYDEDPVAEPAASVPPVVPARKVTPARQAIRQKKPVRLGKR
ncbi:MAG: hypothetical protein OHK005_04990 [Candidatus Methylacidiphilales bacterium]